MPTGTQHAPSSAQRARHGEPQPAPPPTAAEPVTTKANLTSWWKTFKRGNPKKEEEKTVEPEVRGIFAVPLITSIPYANVAISLFNETGESYIYGYVPIVVAKCGVFLKEKATDVEGIFRLAGSEKRIKELKVAFDTPPRYGKGLDWTGYTVHDAANILRRYFNQLPEPIIPLSHYDPFRQPLRNHQAEAVGQIEGQAPSIGGFDPHVAVQVYQHRIKELPSLNRQLLLYILDLLAVFAAKSDINKMTTSNLAAIFQPGILSHPQHDMSPQDYRLSQDVLIFLIDNQDHFLIGMEGTAIDEGTVKHVNSGPSTPQARTPTTPGRNQSGLGRSASAASSAGANSIRKFGGVRRNVSTSSRHSRHSGAVPSPTTPVPVTPSASGVHRSNTLPSKRSPALPGSRFAREMTSDPPTPASPLSEELSTPAAGVTVSAAGIAVAVSQPPVISSAVAEEKKPMEEEKLDVVNPEGKVASMEQSIPAMQDSGPIPSPASNDDSTPTPTGPVANDNMAQILAPPPQQFESRSPHLTPTRERSEFTEGPIDNGPATEISPAVRTFTQILSKVSPSGDEKQARKPPAKKLQKKSRVPSSANPSAHSSTHSLGGTNSGYEPPASPPFHATVPHYPPAGSKELPPHAFTQDTVSSRNSGTTLKPSMSPSASFRSHSTATEYSEAEPTEEHPKEEKRSFWKSHKRGESRATPTTSQTDLGSVPGAEKSMSSFGSSAGQGRRSLQFDSSHGSEIPAQASPETKEQHDKKKPFGSWFREKRQEREAKKQRAKSPPGSTADLHAPQSLNMPHESLATRGRSMDVPRQPKGEEAKRNAAVPPPSPPREMASQQLPSVEQALAPSQQPMLPPQPPLSPMSPMQGLMASPLDNSLPQTATKQEATTPPSHFTTAPQSPMTAIHSPTTTIHSLAQSEEPSVKQSSTAPEQSTAAEIPASTKETPGPTPSVAPTAPTAPSSSDPVPQKHHRSMLDV